MDLKEKLEQRRKERTAIARDTFKQELAATAEAERDAKEQKARLTKHALDVITDQSGIGDSSTPQHLSKEEAEKIIEEAASEATASFGAVVTLCGVGLGIYFGFTSSWGLGLMIALGGLLLAVLLSFPLTNQKKAEMLETHRRTTVAANLPQSQEVGSVETESET